LLIELQDYAKKFDDKVERTLFDSSYKGVIPANKMKKYGWTMENRL
jgi:hypothetical protein